MMTLRDIIETVGGTLVSSSAQLDAQVSSICAADLMSDALAFAAPGSVLLTGLCNPQVVRTAGMADVAAIVFVRGKIPSAETLAVAEDLGIPLVTARCSMYEMCGRLYLAGWRGALPSEEA
jgi:hypothetical protein